MKLDDGSTAPLGFIDSLQAYIFRNGKYLWERNYPAYACYKPAGYPDTNIIFIIDGENLSIKLNLYYRFYDAGIEKYESKEYKLLNPNLVYANKLEIVPKQYNKIFLTRYHTYFKKCKDGSWAFIYLIEDGREYLADLGMRIKI